MGFLHEKTCDEDGGPVYRHNVSAAAGLDNEVCRGEFRGLSYDGYSAIEKRFKRVFHVIKNVKRVTF